MPLPTFTEFEDQLQETGFELPDALDSIDGYFDTIVEERQLSDDDEGQLTDIRYTMREGAMRRAFDDEMNRVLKTNFDGNENEVAAVRDSVLNKFDSGEETDPVFDRAKLIYQTQKDDIAEVSKLYKPVLFTGPHGIDLFSIQRKKHPFGSDKYSFFVGGEQFDSEIPGELTTEKALEEFAKHLGDFKFQQPLISRLFGEDDDTLHKMEAMQVLGFDYFTANRRPGAPEGEDINSGKIAGFEGAINSIRRNFFAPTARGAGEIIRAAGLPSGLGDGEGIENGNWLTALGNAIVDAAEITELSAPPSAETAQGQRQGKVFDWNASWFADNIPGAMAQVGAQVYTGNIFGFVATGTLPHAGEALRDSLDYHSEAAMLRPNEDGSVKTPNEAAKESYGIALLEAGASTLAMAGLEYISGKVFVGTPAGEVVKGTIRKEIAKKAPGFVKKGLTESATEFSQDLANFVVEGVFRGDYSELAAELDNLSSPEQSKLFTSAFLGAIAGGSSSISAGAANTLEKIGGNLVNFGRSSLPFNDNIYAGLNADQRQALKDRLELARAPKKRSQIESGTLNPPTKGKPVNQEPVPQVNLLVYRERGGDRHYVVRNINGSEFDEFDFTDPQEAKAVQSDLADLIELQQGLFKGDYAKGEETENAQKDLASLQSSLDELRSIQYSPEFNRTAVPQAGPKSKIVVGDRPLGPGLPGLTTEGPQLGPEPPPAVVPATTERVLGSYPTFVQAVGEAKKAGIKYSQGRQNVESPILAGELLDLIRSGEKTKASKARIEELRGLLGEDLTGLTARIRGEQERDITVPKVPTGKELSDTLRPEDQRIPVKKGALKEREAELQALRQISNPVAIARARSPFEIRKANVRGKDRFEVVFHDPTPIAETLPGQAIPISPLFPGPIQPISTAQQAAEVILASRQSTDAEVTRRVTEIADQLNARERGREVAGSVEIEANLRLEAAQLADKLAENPVEFEASLEEAMGRLAESGIPRPQAEVISTSAQAVATDLDLLAEQVERNLSPKPLKGKLGEAGFVDMGAISQGVAAAYQFAKGKIEAFGQRLKALFGESISPFITELWESAKNAVGDYLTRVIINVAPAQVQGGAIQKGGPENSKRQLTDVSAPFVETKYKSKGISDSVRQANARINKKVHDDLQQSQAERQTAPEIEAAVRAGEITGTDAEFNRKLREKNRDAADLLEKGNRIINSISTELGRIHPKLEFTLRKFEIDYAGRLQNYIDNTKGFLDFMKETRKANPEIAKQLDLALNNSDTETVRNILRNYGSALAAYDLVTNHVLSNIFDGYRLVGRLDIGQMIDGYFPRKVIPSKRPEYHQWLHNGPLKDEIAQAYDKAEANNKGELLTEFQKEQIANQVISGFYRNNGRRPTGTKARRIEQIKAEALQFYQPAEETLWQYINEAAKDIEIRKFFGRGKEDIAGDYSPEKIQEMQNALGQAEIGKRQLSEEEFNFVINNFRGGPNSIGGVVEGLRNRGEIDQTDITKIAQLLKSRFNYVPTGSKMSLFRDLGYLATLTNPISAITQLEDNVLSAWVHGAYETGEAASEHITGTSEIPLKELPGTIRRAVDINFKTNWVKSLADGGVKIFGTSIPGLFKMSGFDYTDILGKTVIVNSYIKSLRGKSDAEIYEEIKDAEHLFEGTANEFIRDLRDKKTTNDIRFMGLNRLAQMHPIYLSEMSAPYLDNPNTRILFQLKTFSMRRLDFIRSQYIKAIGREGRTLEGPIGKIVSNPEQALRKFVGLNLLIALAGASNDELKDFLLGKDVRFSQNFQNNFWKILFLNKFSTEKLLSTGDLKDFASDIVAPPTLGLTSEFLRLGGNIVDFYGPLGQGDERALAKIRSSRLIDYVPLVGRVYSAHAGVLNLPEIDVAATSFQDDAVAHITQLWGRKAHYIERHVEMAKGPVFGEERTDRLDRQGTLSEMKKDGRWNETLEKERRHLEAIEDAEGILTKEAKLDYAKTGDVQTVDMIMHRIKDIYTNPLALQYFEKKNPKKFLMIPNSEYAKKERRRKLGL